MNVPRVSVLMPCRNGGRTLTLALHSTLRRRSQISSCCFMMTVLRTTRRRSHRVSMTHVSASLMMECIVACLCGPMRVCHAPAGNISRAWMQTTSVFRAGWKGRWLILNGIRRSIS
jgi:hypothetical protein